MLYAVPCTWPPKVMSNCGENAPPPPKHSVKSVGPGTTSPVSALPKVAVKVSLVLSAAGAPALAGCLGADCFVEPPPPHAASAPPASTAAAAHAAHLSWMVVTGTACGRPFRFRSEPAQPALYSRA